MLTPLNSLSMRILRLSFCIFLIVFASIPAFSQVQIWGASQQGGSDAIGSIFQIYDDGSDLEQKAEFINSREGNEPKSKIVIGSDGDFYGITASGGANGAGTIFKYGDPGFEVLYDLIPATDGSNSNGDMVEVSDGVFIGTTASAAEFNGGSLFRFSLEDGFSILHSFQPATDGGNPVGAIAFNNNTIYGACSSGGSAGFGTCFSYNLTGLFTVQHNFLGGVMGSYPQGGLILGSDELLYGTSQFGGAHSQGSIFKVNPAGGAFEIIYDINSATADGRYPFGRLVESSDGVFMGTCSEGGTNGTGTVFKITSGGVFTRLRSLQPTNDGGFPKSGLVKGNDEILYGVTEFGGQNGFGTIYSITEAGAFVKILDMEFSANGSHPRGTLAFDGNNSLVGTGSDGGANNFGTLFTLSTPDLSLTKLHDFSLPIEGSTPVSIYRNGVEFYGITQLGGLFNTGTFFKIGLDGTKEVLHDFNPEVGGQNPNGDLFLGDDGYYYGTSRFGGQFNSGTVFKISTEGEITVLHDFDGTLGQFPYGGVVKHSNGLIYGTTITGGEFTDGIVFSVSEAGDFNVLTSFFGFFEGGSPEGSLTIGADSNIYGTTTQGGSSGVGSLFQINPEESSVTALHFFSDGMEGGTPKGKLLLHSDGNLYGTTTTGVNGGGSIFRYNLTTGIELLHGFMPGSDGFECIGGLAEDEVGTVYGFCSSGGLLNSGTVFSYDQTDGFETIYSFEGANSTPTGTPALFFPECYGDEGCASEDPCSVAICNFGICEEIAINPLFSTINIGDCQVGLDVFDLTLELSMNIHPGGIFQIGTLEVELIDGLNTYQITIPGLPSDGSNISLDYTFLATGCSGTIASLGTAPEPCPPVVVNFVLDAANLEVSPEGIHIGGSFQGWTPAEHPMELSDEGFWETTITIGSGEHEFNFFNGSSLFDGEYVIGDCALNGKRILEVGEESLTVSYCWSNCNENCTPPVGISDNNGFIAFSLIPNITNRGGNLNLEIPSLNADLNYALINITGQTLQSDRINAERTPINTGNLDAGMYNIILTDNSSGNIVGVKRFIIQ